MADWQPIKASKLSSLPTFRLQKVQENIQNEATESTKPLIRHQTGHEDSNDILKPDTTLVEKAKELAKDPTLSGYTHSCGMPVPRKAVASAYSLPDCELTDNDVILFQGNDMAINHVMRAFCNENENFLVPSPCDGHWVDSAPGYDFVAKTYKLLPDNDWKVDLKDLESKIDDKTKFIVVANPSGPTGRVYSKEHLLEIIAIADKHKIPLVADETYYNFTFEGNEFIPLASLAGEIPVVQISGGTKQYQVPGWRISWVIFYDRKGYLKNFVAGFQNIMQLMLHPAPYLQMTIPVMFNDVKKEHLAAIMTNIQKNHDLVFSTFNEKLSKFFKAHKANSGENLIVQADYNAFKDIKTDEEFAQKFYKEENVLLMPLSAYHSENGLVVSTALKSDLYADFFERLIGFCDKHKN